MEDLLDSVDQCFPNEQKVAKSRMSEKSCQSAT